MLIEETEPIEARTKGVEVKSHSLFGRATWMDASEIVRLHMLHMATDPDRWAALKPQFKLAPVKLKCKL